MMETLEQLDQDLFFFLNSLHSDFLDPIMLQATETITWLPVYIIILVLMIRAYGWHTVLWLLAISLAVTLSDQLTSSIMKPFFERLRPSHDPALEGLVHIVEGYRGGKYGFVSSHAANAFAVATVVFLSLRAFHPRIWLMFLVAGVIAYTRIYLGVHYPADILIGALIGIFFGWVCFRLVLWVTMKCWPLQS